VAKNIKSDKPKNPVHVELGSKLWKFQQDLGLTQEALGAKFSTKRADQFARRFSSRMIQGYESGENELSGELLFNIWQAGYSVDQLFEGTTAQYLISSGGRDPIMPTEDLVADPKGPSKIDRDSAHVHSKTAETVSLRDHGRHPPRRTKKRQR